MKHGKPCTDDCLSIDANQWQREGWLTAGVIFNATWQRNGEIIASIGVTVGTEQLTLSYQANGQPMTYPITLKRQPVHLGGFRHWFLCPSCQRQAAKLYCRDGLFLCRHCHDLGYRCQRESDCDNAIRRAGKLRKKLNWQAGIANPEGGKPKWMHRRTFERLRDEQWRYQRIAINGMMSRFKFLDDV